MNLSEGGWIPKVNIHRNSQGNKHKGFGNFNQTLCTLFIDNLPEEVDLGWLRKYFNKFGFVKDVYIPVKRSKRTGSKFGFVRYDCHVAAGVAISKSNGLWVQDKQLFVKEASFGHFDGKPALKLPSLLRTDVGTSNYEAKEFLSSNLDADFCKIKNYDKGKSYAQAVTGVSKNLEAHDSKDIVLKFSPSGNDWLSRSVVGLLQLLISREDLQKEFYKEHGVNVIIRDMGGRSILITFPNEELRNVSVKEQWLKRCFVSLKPWNGDATSLERLTWINCFGLPLNVWCMNTFKKIGECWGQLLSVDDDTLYCKSFVNGRLLIVTKESSRIDRWIKIEVDGGLVYDVRILEDNSAPGLSMNDFLPSNMVMHDCGVATDSSSIHVDAAVNAKKDISTNEVHVVDAKSLNDLDCVADNIIGEVELGEETHKLDQKIESLQFQVVHQSMEANCCKTAVSGAQVVGDSELLVSFDGKNADLVGTIKEKEVEEFDQGFWNLAEVGFLNEKDVQGIELFVDLNPTDVVKDSRKAKWKHKKISEMMVFPKSKKMGGRKKKKKKKCVVFRSAIAAAALSVSSEGMNKFHLNSAQATRSINKILGEDYLGDDDEIIRSFSVESR